MQCGVLDRGIAQLVKTSENRILFSCKGAASVYADGALIHGAGPELSKKSAYSAAVISAITHVPWSAGMCTAGMLFLGTGAVLS